MALDNKLSNIIGTKLPQWVINQLSVRADQNSKGVRDNENLRFLANKSAWIRLVSSVNITDTDLRYFSTKVPGVNKPEDLAKQYVLFGGTSVYVNENSYSIRSGISGIKPNGVDNGSYGILGKEEVQKYGYRPMPGITGVNIETQGRLGSVRQATINFKCWDKSQLDVIDALYFKLGYTMFLEWGHTYYYPSAGNPNDPANQNVNKLKTTELSIIDPFAEGLTKEKVFRQISKNSRQTEGNYDAMLGIVTNFNFSMNQEGGYDCSIRIMSLGVLGDSLKINNSSILPGILKDEVLLLKNTLEIQQQTNPEAEVNLLQQLENEKAKKANEAPSIFAYINTKEVKKGNLQPEISIENYDNWIEPLTPRRYEDIIRRYGILGSDYEEFIPVSQEEKTRGEIITNAKELDSYRPAKNSLYDFIYDDPDFTGETLFLQKFGIRIPEENIQNYISSVTLDLPRIRDIITRGSYNVENIVNQFYKEKNFFDGANTYTSPNIPYLGLNGEYYFIKFKISLSRDYNPIVESAYESDPEKKQIKSITISGNKIDLSNSPVVDGRNEVLKELIKIFLLGPKFSSKEFSGDKDFSSGGSLGDSYKLSIEKSVDYKVDLNLFEKDKKNIKIGSINSSGFSSQQIFELTVSGVYNFNLKIAEKTSGIGSFVTSENDKNFSATYEISITDASLIKNVVANPDAIQFKEYYKLEQESNLRSQNQIEQERAQAQQSEQEALSSQILEALSYQSALEILLRTIQVKSLNRAFYDGVPKDKPDLEIGRKVYKYEFWKDKKFTDQIFSNGVYQDIIRDLIDGKITNQNYNDDDQQRKINAKYGFATTLLGSNALKEEEVFSKLTGKEVDYKELLNAYVVPYQIDQDLIAGVKTNHPVYIPLGLLCTILNHICTLYDTKAESKDFVNSGGLAGALTNAAISATKIVTGKQKPLVYIDYNPKLNFFLTNPQQLSTNPWVTLIPYEGSFDDYKKLFDAEVITGNNINSLSSDQSQKVPLFNPQTQDLLSFYLPKIKDGNNYRGRLMNVLLNIDYLTSLVRDYSFRDGNNNVYLKPFLEHILSDLNKYLGNFNSLRLAYNDIANTFQFIDDQYIPSIENETQIPPVPTGLNLDNRTELPLFGLNSIARSLELKTEISSRLSNTLAISANSDPKEQVQSSTNGDAFGFINSNYVDRYIPRKIAAGDKSASKKDGEIVASIQFNQTVSDFYSKINPSYSDVSQITSFFIDKMSVVKNDSVASRSSMLIPVGINFSTDGIGGLCMGQAFTVSQEFLPYSYYSKKPGNIFDGYVNRVGFVIVGLSHTIDNNSWITTVRTQMMPVKDSTVFKGSPVVLKQNTDIFESNQNNFTGETPNADRLRLFLKKFKYLEKIEGSIGEISNGGDISENMASVAISLFGEIKTKAPSVVIKVTGGNDVFHKKLTQFSTHKIGNGLDFVVVNETPANIEKVTEIINEFKDKTKQILFLNEYDPAEKSQNATANHFHISVI